MRENYGKVIKLHVLEKAIQGCYQQWQNQWNECVNSKAVWIQTRKILYHSLYRIYWKQMDGVTVFLDLEKDFDKVGTIEEIQGKIRMDEKFSKRKNNEVTIRDKSSTWKKFIIGVPQGLVFAPVMFAIYVKDMDEGVDSYMSFYASDTKLLRRVGAEGECRLFQHNLDKLWEWSQK